MVGLTHVLIPGAGSDASYWHALVPLLRARGHDVVTLDLPCDDDRAGLPEYVDTVVQAIGERRDIVVVAQSMAGFTAPLVCQRVPVREIVLLNAMIPLPGETPGEWWGATGQEAAKREMDLREGRDPEAPFDVHAYFLDDVPQEALQKLREPRRQSDTPFGSPCTFEAWPDVPTHVIVGRDDRFFPAAFQRRIARDRLGLTADEIPGGHLAALSHPRELADLLEQYAAQLG